MLLKNKRVGLILRVFSPKRELVAQTAQQIYKLLAVAHNLMVGDDFAFSRIDVLVSADQRYGDSDCGGTREAIQSLLDEEKNEEIRWLIERDSAPFIGRDVIHVSEVRHGDIFCGLLNYGIAKQLRDRIDYSMILSMGVKEYLTIKNMAAMLLALEAGAKVTGLAIAELEESILRGRIANTCAIWDNVALMTVGGFDLMARKAKVRGEDRPNAGVEEIIPLIRLVELFDNECIAPIEPVDTARWEEPTDPDVLARHKDKMSRKLSRQLAHAKALGYDNLEVLAAGVMKKYWLF